MITIYSSHWCSWCSMAKRLLDEQGLDYKEINIQDIKMTRFELESLTGGRTVPQIVINDMPIGGFENLYALSRSGKLQSLLSS